MRNFLLTYDSDETESRMSHTTDLKSARKSYVKGANSNLIFLLKHRAVWMNEWLRTESVGIELGAGIGSNLDFIICEKLELSDIGENDWLDFKNLDSLETGLANETYDFVIASNMIHHVAYPTVFFNESNRILKPGGMLFIQEINSSLFMRLILKLMKHEGFDETINVFDSTSPVNSKDDPWSANCSVPKLLFGNLQQFYLNFPQWDVIHLKPTEFLIFLNSGGVIAKTRYIPLTNNLLRIFSCIDAILCRIAPKIFALQMQVILRKKMS